MRPVAFSRAEYEALSKTLQLTRAQLKVARLAADGLTNVEIAAELYLTEQTIKFHLTDVLRKLRLRNRSQILRRLVEFGLMPCPCSEIREIDVRVDGVRYRPHA